ncbi:MAG: hypothetical protein IKK89_11240 [Alistipes sp.]|nr:hypothetical protein [Alistipes sp.]
MRRRFIDEAFGGDYKAYLRARQDDYCKVQFEWSCWIDALCKNGEITQAQYEQAIF